MTTRIRGLLIDTPPIVRSADLWREVRDCNEGSRNRARIEEYRLRLQASLDPYADVAMIERRAVAGLAVQRALRRRDIGLRLQRRLRAASAQPAPVPEPAPPANVVAMRHRRGRGAA